MIRIAKLTDYAIVLLSCFASDPEQPVHNARDLASKTGVPLPTVSKILKALARGDLVVSQRGVNGGYRLSRDAGAISIADIIAAVEGPIAMTECSVEPAGLCEREGACPVGANWQKINRVVGDALDGLTLADMARPLRAQATAARRGREPVRSAFATGRA